MSKLFHLDPANPTPLYAQLERAIRFAVMTGRLQIGDQLPTVRQLAVDLRINANTVAKVYAELERSGVVETRRGVGTFVLAPAPPQSSARRGERERTLRSLAEHFLAETAALGFTPDEVIRYLANWTGKKEIRKHG
ncbi:MAG TPA: GntR family transcriptional regulator [Pyrinomonadaceae bacterium]|nr:GntR family transcriptional regulator [Pyrinomonadaceae bacterium]